MKYWKRTLCTVLSLCLLMMMLPVASAADTDQRETGHSITLNYNIPNPVGGIGAAVHILYTGSPGEFVLPAPPDRPGFTFTGWADEDNTVYQSGDTVWVTPARDCQFYAQWKTIHPFTDLTGTEQYFNDVMYLMEKGIMTGTSASTFTPDATFNRAMLWTVLARINGADVEGGEPWYGKARDWAMSQGITDGTAPQRAVSVQELAAMLYRQAGSPEVTSELYGFQVAAWARDGLNWALINRLVDLHINDASAAFVTRGELAASLGRFCKLAEGA